MKKDKLDCMAYVDDLLIEKADSYTGAKKRNVRIAWSAVAACLCLTAVIAAVVLPKSKIKTDGSIGDSKIPGAISGTGDAAPVAVGTDAGSYSVAVFPADRTTDEIRTATCETIDEAQAQGEAGLGEYLPSLLPDGYHFDVASIYVTTMKDGTVYKLLRVTYITGEKPEASTDEEGAAIALSPDAMGSEFRVCVFDFKPDTSCEIYTQKEIRKEAADGGLDSGFFYVL